MKEPFPHHVYLALVLSHCSIASHLKVTTLTAGTGCECCCGGVDVPVEWLAALSAAALPFDVSKWTSISPAPALLGWYAFIILILARMLSRNLRSWWLTSSNEDASTMNTSTMSSVSN